MSHRLSTIHRERASTVLTSMEGSKMEFVNKTSARHQDLITIENQLGMSLHKGPNYLKSTASSRSLLSVKSDRSQTKKNRSPNKSNHENKRLPPSRNVPKTTHHGSEIAASKRQGSFKISEKNKRPTMLN